LFLYRHVLTSHLYCSHYRKTAVNKQEQNGALNMCWQS
jgi:hypothetical protein